MVEITAIYRLEKWSVCAISPYSSPEMGKCLQGVVYGHSNFADGDFIITSKIIEVRNGIITTHSGSKYVLGEVDEKYEKYFPNARERILKEWE